MIRNSSRQFGDSFSGFGRQREKFICIGACIRRNFTPYRLVLRGYTKGADNQDTDILEISPSLLEGIDGVGEKGKGRFGTVCLKKFRSTPVAVKYFDLSSTAKVVEREAMYLRRCCHINLPISYGINVKEKPFFIVSQYHGNESFKAFTLQNIIHEDAGITISGSEHWLHMIQGPKLTFSLESQLGTHLKIFVARWKGLVAKGKRYCFFGFFLATP